MTACSEKCGKVGVEIEQVKASVVALRKEQKKEGSILEKRHQKQEPKALENALHMTVEGVRVRFTYIDTTDEERDFNIVIDVSTPTYKAPTRPPVIASLSLLATKRNTGILQIRKEGSESVCQSRSDPVYIASSVIG